MSAKKKLLFLFSDTGGGHRSSVEAVTEAINHVYPNKFIIDQVDFFRSYSPWPFNKSAESYPLLLKFDGRLWEYFFKLSNNSTNFTQVANIIWPYVKQDLQQIFADYQDDLIVSFHPLINLYLDKLGVKHVVVITDLVTAHAAWYSSHPIKYFVPTQEIKTTGTQLGINPKLIQITGLPVSLRFKPKPLNHLINSINLITILLMGGGQGLGKLYLIAQSLNRSKLPIKLVVVAGRNPNLLSQLQKLNWEIPVEIYGFTREIPRLMQTSDILLTKAGPSTIVEGLTAGLPIIIYDYLKGQEAANVDFIVNNHAGFYCPDNNSLTHTLNRLINSINLITELKINAKKLSTPHASLDIAKGLYKLVS